MIPTHIAFIMDGNRRWAKKRLLPTLFGHKEGAKRIEPLVKYAKEKGVKYLTFWAFSTENWKRDKEEVEYLLNLFREVLKDPMMDRLHDEGVQIRVMGDITAFPEDISQIVEDLVEKTKDNNTCVVVLALNYGGRAEILKAVNSLLKDNVKEVTSEIFESYLDTTGIPDPDMIVRTGGEKRLSGYLPWQAIYSELYFCDTYWPDFTEEEFDKVLSEYSERERRFGK